VPSSEKRERQRQNRDARRVAEFEAEKKRKRNRSIRNFGLLLIPLVIVFVVLQVTRSDNSSSKSSSSSNIACGAKAPAKNEAKKYDSPPAMSIDTSKTYTAAMDTSCGTIEIALDAKTYPTSVNNFVFLSQQKFYDGLLFNRVSKDFVIQGGSPDNTTAGGPGYTVVGEVPSTTPAYPVGSLAMAKTGAEPTGTMGSQYFIVTGGQNSSLPAEYAFVGSVTKGLDVAQKIAGFYPSSGDGVPTKDVYVNTVTIKES
jgi:peptidylprolyl isomerase